ncbi:MAG: response regulator transcription factor [Bacteroidaceae bacterium]|nr:response regulator transcription factor [Bacteroidaceae bacterium]
MSLQLQIAVISPFTLANIGLKQLLCDFFAIGTIGVYSNTDDFLSARPEQYDLFFVTADTFFTHSDFFLPRKNKTVILSDREFVSEEKKVLERRLYIYDDTESIIEKLERILNSIDKRSADDTHEELSPREIEVLQLVAQGYINKEIADKLNISFNTVLTHRKNITTKLGIKTVSGLSFYAMMNGYVTTKDIE